MKKGKRFLALLLCTLIAIGTIQESSMAAELSTSDPVADESVENVDDESSIEEVDEETLFDTAEDDDEEAEVLNSSKENDNQEEDYTEIKDLPDENEQIYQNQENVIEKTETGDSYESVEQSDDSDLFDPEIQNGAEAEKESESLVEEVETENTAQLETAIMNEALDSEVDVQEDAVYWCGHNYLVFDEALTPAEASAKCESMGGYLATATTQAEYDLIWGLISAKSKGKPAYQMMGIHKESDGWYWDDGEEFCFRTWAGFDKKWGGDGWHTLSAGCLGWSDDSIKEVIAYGRTPLYKSSYNGWGWSLYLNEGTSCTNHNIAICNGNLTFTRYANWGGRSSVAATGGMVEYNEETIATGYVCEWGEPIVLTESNVFLNGQKKGNESPVKYTYSGEAKQPNSIKVYYDNIELTLNQDYTYEIKSRSTVGAATVNVKGINRFQGLAKKYYYIIPRKVTGVSGGSDTENKGLAITWDELDETSEYDIRWSSNKTNLVNNKADIYNYTHGETDDKTYYTGSLKYGTTYYIQVRGVGDRAYQEDIGEWSDIVEIKTENGLWMTIFSNKNQILDGGHAFLNIENETDEDFYIGRYKLSAGDNVYIAGRGIGITETHVKESEGGIFLNFEGVKDWNAVEENGDNYYRDFSWYTVGIAYEDLEKLYACMREYGTYDKLTNNCAHFASTAWNSIVDDDYKVPSTGLPGTLKNYISDTLKGKSATELKLEEKDITDILILDSRGYLMPYTLDSGNYFKGVNSLKVVKTESTSVTLEWISPAEEYGEDNYSITDLYIVYSDENGTSNTVSLEPNVTEQTINGLKPGTKYSFKLYGVSDHRSVKAGIVTGKESSVLCEATTKRVEGWVKENGDWFYYKNDGTKLTNDWAKDSTGWCWMDANGRITKNKWIQSGGQWYYLKANGYMAANEWAKDSTGWCWMDGSGKITKNKWIQSGGQWYYLKANGYMAANEWAKDSTGWCWMDGSGKITKNKWIQSGGQWYYLKANGYMAANEWAKDSGGWYWMDGNGKITRSKWIQTGGKWYYLGANGYMVTGTQKIGGKTYKFNSSGALIQ